MRRFAPLFGFAVLAAFTAGAAQAENNALYDSWAKHKPGTMVKVKMVTEAAGNKTEMETTQTLKEVTPEKVVVDTQTTMTMMGQKLEQPAQPMEIPAKMEAGQAAAAQAQKAADVEVKESEETVTVSGQSVKAKVVETKDKTTWSKAWTSADVPGTVVKMESKTTGDMATSTTMELVEMSIK